MKSEGPTRRNGESGTVELIVLAPSARAARCRVLGSAEEVSYRYASGCESPGEVPGEIITVQVAKTWTFGAHRHVAGSVTSRRLDASALGLVPLRLDHRYDWDPMREAWRDDDEPPEEWHDQILALGTRPAFEMEDVTPSDPADVCIDDVIDEYESGDPDQARAELGKMLTADLRCLDAHAHLGSFSFDWPKKSIRHFEAAVRIGELSLGPDFTGVLPWSCLGNRPFLGCLHSFGICLWRLERRAEAEAVFRRLLALNPNDNQGVQMDLADLRSGATWTDDASW